MRTISNVSVTIHNVEQVTAKFHRNGEHAWLDLVATDSSGREQEVCLFAASLSSAQNLESLAIFLQRQNALENPLPRIINPEYTD